MIETAMTTPKLTANVDYVRPDFAGLRRQFPISVNAYCEGRTFVPIESCQSVSRTPRKIVFDYVDMDNATSEEVLVEMKRLGLRPALFEELLAYELEYPQAQGGDPVVALGSMLDPTERRRVAYLYDPGYLWLGWFDGIWIGRHRFLAVRG
jgi:hypothetical protein